jgi:hypothetical protein
MHFKQGEGQSRQRVRNLSSRSLDFIVDDLAHFRERFGRSCEQLRRSQLQLLVRACTFTAPAGGIGAFRAALIADLAGDDADIAASPILTPERSFRLLGASKLQCSRCSEIDI